METKEMEIIEEVEELDEADIVVDDVDVKNEEEAETAKKPNVFVRAGKFLWRHKKGILITAGAVALGAFIGAKKKSGNNMTGGNDGVKALPGSDEDNYDYDEDDYEEDEIDDETEVYDEEPEGNEE